MFCTHCGHQSAPGARFCPACGAPPAPSAAPDPVDLAPSEPSWTRYDDGPVEFLDEPVPDSGPRYLAPGVGAPPGSGAPHGVGAPHGTDATWRPRRGRGVAEATVVERLLGGDWRPAVSVALPTVLVAGMLGAVTASSQLFTATPINRGLLSEDAGRSTAAYFHGLARNVAQAFGAPLHTSLNATDGLGGRLASTFVPLGVSVGTVLVFALLLRRACVGLGPAARVVTALRAGAVVVAAIAVVSAFGDSTTTVRQEEFGYSLHLTVSPWWALLWSSVTFAVVGGVIAARPLHLVARLLLPLRHDEWYPAWAGAVAATATAVVLGAVAAVAAAFEHLPGRADTARLVPQALGHLVDLGTQAWTVSLLGADVQRGQGRPRGDDATFSLLHRQGLSPLYLFALLLPVLSVGVGALMIRRYRGTVHPRVLSRCCYRMAVPVALLYAVLGTLATARFTQFDRNGVTGPDHVSLLVGPQVLLTCAYAFGWYLVLGFAAGRVLLLAERRADVVVPSESGPEPVPVPVLPAGFEAVPGHRAAVVPQAWTPSRPPVEPRRLGVLFPLVVGAVAVAVLAGSAVAAGVRHGGRDAHGAVAIQGTASDGDRAVDPAEDDPTGEGTQDPSTIDPDTADAEDDQAQYALLALSAAEERYLADNQTYTDDNDALEDFVEPEGVSVIIDYADDTEFCAVAGGIDSGNTYTYDSAVGHTTSGQNC